MSDIRTKLLMGTTISAVSLMLVMAIGISSEQNNVSDASTTFGLLGHFEIMVENPDGTASYAQSDNFVTGAAKTDVAELVFLGNAIAGKYDCTRLGSGTPVVGTDGVNAAFAVTGLACGDDASGTEVCDGGGATSGTAEICTITTVHTMDSDCDPSCTITEVEIGVGTSGLNNVLSDRFAYTALDGNVIANNGAEVTTTYKVATGGTIP